MALQPAASFDTEGLLAHPRMEHVSGHRILVIKGSGGRPVLQQELERRGASVVNAEVYERTPAAPSAAVLAAVQERFAARDVQVIVVTSLEVARNLLDIAGAELRREFAHVHWLVPGERIAAGLRELGLAAPLLQAQSAEDHDLVAALIRWRSSVSDA